MDDKYTLNELSIYETSSGRMVCTAIAVAGQYAQQADEMARICLFLNEDARSNQ
jgi:hypothetical protein